MDGTFSVVDPIDAERIFSGGTITRESACAFILNKREILSLEMDGEIRVADGVTEADFAHLDDRYRPLAIALFRAAQRS